MSWYSRCNFQELESQSQNEKRIATQSLQQHRHDWYSKTRCLQRYLLIFCHLTTRSSAIAEGPRDASCQLKSCQLPRNSAETTYTTSPDQIDGMKLEI